MTSVEPLLATNQNRFPELSFIPDDVHPFSGYVQDITSAPVPPQDPDQQQPVAPYVAVDQQQTIWLTQALIWPAGSLQEGTMLPYATAATAGLLVAPLVDSSVGIGAAIAAGYAIGAITFYLQHKDRQVSRAAPKTLEALKRSAFTPLRLLQSQALGDSAFA